jgi:CheY-like chemotaxis protein
MLTELLTLHHHDVRTAHDGANAIQLTDEFKPEFVFLDIGLPGMTGYEVAQRIRQAPSGDRIFLVTVTGWGQPADRRRSTESGFDVHLVKPVAPDVVLSLVAGASSSRAH